MSILERAVVAVEFLSDEQAAGYGAFPEFVPRGELERYFFLDDADRELVRDKRRAHNRERKVLLPGVTRLARLVGSCREAANQRLWETLHDHPR
ncbi:DUF4158 domain-containing protein [Saccharopolyspora shandongensis]|uniref:DUF4158 domain-containing protein n=1 Tax=Saccharopolyspora shandongensis TaxID=418495 RepID=UPI003444E0E2